MSVPLSGDVDDIIEAAFSKFSKSPVLSKAFLNSKELSRRLKVANLLKEVPELEDDDPSEIEIVLIEQQPTVQSGMFGMDNLCCMDCYNA